MNDYKIFVIENNKNSNKLVGKFFVVMLLFFLLAGIGMAGESAFYSLFHSSGSGSGTVLSSKSKIVAR